MKKFLLRWFASGVSIYATAWLLESVDISGFGTAMIAAAILGVANMIIKPILVLFTLPINILTLGLFTFVINGIVLKIAAGLVDGFTVSGLIAPILAAIVLSIIQMIVGAILGVKKDKK